MKVIFTNEESEFDKWVREFLSCMLTKYCIEIDKQMCEGLNYEYEELTG